MGTELHQHCPRCDAPLTLTIHQRFPDGHIEATLTSDVREDSWLGLKGSVTLIETAIVKTPPTPSMTIHRVEPDPEC